MDNTLIYIIFLEDLSCFTKKEEPSTEEFEQSRDGYLDILRVDNDGRVCRFIGRQQYTKYYWEQVDSFEEFMKRKNK